MDHKPAAQANTVSGIDLEFRPRSYFWPLSLDKHLLVRIKGAERRTALEQLINAGFLDQVPDLLAQSALSELVILRVTTRNLAYIDSISRSTLSESRE